MRITVSVQGWRELGDAGALWSPGRLVHLTCDWLGVDDDLLISTVSQRVDARGRVSTLELVPRGAFSAEPVSASAPPEETSWWS